MSESTSIIYYGAEKDPYLPFSFDITFLLFSKKRN